MMTLKATGSDDPILKVNMDCSVSSCDLNFDVCSASARWHVAKDSVKCKFYRAEVTSRSLTYGE